MLRGLFRKKNPKPNIGLSGDMDDVEILVHLEKRFKIRISDPEALSMKNVGELYDLLASKVSNQDDFNWEQFIAAIEPFANKLGREIHRRDEFFKYV